MFHPAFSAVADKCLNFGRISGSAFLLAPDESGRDDDDSDMAWEIREPLDEELDDSDADLEWRLDDETEEESPLPDDWAPDDEDLD